MIKIVILLAIRKDIMKSLYFPEGLQINHKLALVNVRNHPIASSCMYNQYHYLVT